MPDLLIRDFPAEDLELLDKQAQDLGMSRAQFLRRQLHQTARRTAVNVVTADLVRLADLASDLTDASVIDQAWS